MLPHLARAFKSFKRTDGDGELMQGTMLDV